MGRRRMLCRYRSRCAAFQSDRCGGRSGCGLPVTQQSSPRHHNTFAVGMWCLAGLSAVHPTPMTGAHQQRSGTNRAGTWFLSYRNTGGLRADEIADCRGRPGCICHALTRSRVLHRPRHHYETLHHRRTATHHPNHDYRGSGNGLYHTNGSRRRDEDREGLRKRRNGRWSSCSACSALNRATAEGRKRKKPRRKPGLLFVCRTKPTSRKSSIFAMRALSRELGHGPSAADRSDEQSDQEKQ